MSLSKKGLTISTEMVMVIIIIMVILFITVPLIGKEGSDVKEVIGSVQSCSGKGGVCIAVGETADCLLKVKGLSDCTDSKPICCITNEPQDLGSIGSVRITNINIPERLSTSFVAICDVNVEAAGCIYVTVNDRRISCSSEEWSSYVSSSTGAAQTQARFVCPIPSNTPPGTRVCCVIDSSKCNPQDENQLSACGQLG
ncbi:hypothetical protein JXB28_00810 [Candidatus Woesearchaeota archaeon]|nr:hypothetical protein [Candidatus Woesearchaeota archaeon]